MSQPSRQTLVNDVDITPIGITTQVDMPENGIGKCTLTASNEDAQAYLSKLSIGDTVMVKGLANSNEAYYIENSINWLTVLPFFVGTIQELVPSLAQSGQVVRAVAFGVGFQLKQLRIMEEIGNILPVPTIAPVYTYDGTIDNWADTGLSSSTGTFGYAPFINKYSGLVWILDALEEPTYIACSLSGHINSTGCKTPSVPTGTDAATIGVFNFNLSPDYVGGEFAQVELHIVAGVTTDTTNNSGSYPSTVTITPYYSIDDGVTWNAFTNGSFAVSQQVEFNSNTVIGIDIGEGTYWNNYSGGSYGPTTIAAGTGGTTGGTFGPYIPPIWATYQPLIYLFTPPQGQDIPLNILPDLPAWNSNFKVKLCITGATPSAVGGVSIAMMYLYVNFSLSSGFTVRQLISGENIGFGLVPNFVNQTMPDSVNLGGLPSGYSPALNTDYVVKDDPTNVSNLISYIMFPYEDCLTAMQDIIKYGSALQFLQNKSGYHWIVNPLGNLLLAPCSSVGLPSPNNHHVTGLDGSHYVDAVPNTIPWVSQPYSTPQVVKQNMIVESFKVEPPVYNYVLVAGSFQFPLNDDFFRNNDISMWLNTNTASYPPQYTSADGTSSGIYGSGSYGTEFGTLKFDAYTDMQTPFSTILFLPANDSTIVYLRPFNSVSPFTGAIDFTKLMGKKTVPSIEFWLRTGGGTGGYKLKLYVANGNGSPKLDSWFENSFGGSSGGQDNWGYVNVQLPNSKYQRDYNGWQIKASSVVYGIEHSPLSLDWSDLAHIAYFGIEVTSTVYFGGLFGQPYFQMYGFAILGTLIRAMYDSSSITTYGCRMTTVKDTFAQTDTMAANDLTSPLSLEGIYDLQRYRKVRTTGEISIPFDPIWQAGQQVWVQAEDVIPIGSTVFSGTSIPTTSTVGAIGNYYVDTTTWEVYLCTNVVGSTYTWTDQSTVRYKINQWFRITNVTQTFNSTAALTSLTLTNDLSSSLTVDTTGVYSVTQRAINPDFQSKTLGSLKSKDDFDLGLVPIAFDVHDYMVATYGSDTL